MKTVLVVLLGLTGVHSVTLQEDVTARTFVPVALPAPQNWIAGSTLFPGRVISGDHGDLKQYTAKTWAAHMLNECKNQTTCTTVLSFQATNSGNTGGRYWFGYTFGGPKTTVKDFTRAKDVTGSTAYTVSK